MALMGAGFMATFVEVAEELDQDLREWYHREHLRERVDLPGFRRARKYEAVDAEIAYMSTYECDTPDDIGSPAYLDILANPSEWSRKFQPNYTKAHRLLGRTVIDMTSGFGGGLGVLRFVPHEEATELVVAWLNSGVLEEMVSRNGVVGTCVVAADLEVEDRMRAALGMDKTSEPPEWAILVEASEPGIASSCLAGLLTDVEQRHSTATPLAVESYRFTYGVSV